MKTKIIAIFCVLLTVMLSSSVLAELAVTDFTLGDDRTKRDNPEGRDDRDKEGDVKSADFTITNTANETISNIQFSFGALVNRFNLTFSETGPFTLQENGTKTVTVTGVLPRDLASLVTITDRSTSESRQTAGPFTVTGDKNSTAVSTTGTMFAQAESGLFVRNIDILIDGEVFRPDSVDVREITPGSRVSVRFELENRFRLNSFLDIDGDITLSTNNRDAEFVDRFRSFDLRSDDRQSFTLDLDIDWRNVRDNDRVTLRMEIEGEDRNRAKHTVDVSLNIGFRYPIADVAIVDFRFNPTSVCKGDFVEYSFEIENLGTRDQNNLRTRLRSTVLGIEEISSRFSIDRRDRDRTESKFFVESLQIPQNAQSRTYDFIFEVFFQDRDNRETSKFMQVPLTVRDCEEQTPTPVPPNQTGTGGFEIETGANQGGVTPQPQEPSTPGAGIVTAQPRPATNNVEVLLLVALILVLLAVIGFLTLKIVKK